MSTVKGITVGSEKYSVEISRHGQVKATKFVGGSWVEVLNGWEEKGKLTSYNGASRLVRAVNEVCAEHYENQ